MRGLRYSLYVLLIFVMSGCALFGIPRYGFKKNDIGIRFAGNYAPEIEDKLNIDGYYYIDRPYTLDMYAFYPDGTYLGFVFDKGYNYIGKNTNNLDSLIRINKGRNLSFNGGIFKIKGDTLEIHFFWRYYYLRWAYYWQYEIEKFEIVDKNTLRCIECIYMARTKNGTRRYQCNQIYRFAKASPLPSPFEVRSKAQKWMWENKDDWKAYMIEVNKYLDSKVALDSVN